MLLRLSLCSRLHEKNLLEVYLVGRTLRKTRRDFPLYAAYIRRDRRRRGTYLNIIVTITRRLRGPGRGIPNKHLSIHLRGTLPVRDLTVAAPTVGRRAVYDSTRFAKQERKTPRERERKREGREGEHLHACPPRS